LERFLARLQRAGRAELAVMLDRSGCELGRVEGGSTSPLIASLAARARLTGVPVLWVEPPSSRPQARSNVELVSVIVLPLELPGSPGLTVVLQRHSRSAFSSADLEAAMRQLSRLRPQLGLEPGPGPALQAPVPVGNAPIPGQ
jgi:hypothetical protein